MPRSTDFICLVSLMGSYSFGRGPDLGKAIDRCKRESRDTAKLLGGFRKGAEVTLHIFDVSGMCDISIEADGIRCADKGHTRDERIPMLTSFIWKP
jgi:hypothetical protein